MDRTSVGFVVVGGCSLVLWLTLAAAPGAAQSRDSGRHVTSGNTPRATNSAATSTLLTNGRVESPPQVGLPPNVEVSSVLWEVVERMWQHSPTFRVQCARLRRAALTVRLRMYMLYDGGIRALSRVVVEEGALKRADVDISSRYVRDTVELIAHELEHLIEQLDGVDLRLQMTRGAATRTGRNQYETLRAVEVGRRVSREVRDGGSAAHEERPTLGR